MVIQGMITQHKNWQDIITGEGYVISKVILREIKIFLKKSQATLCVGCNPIPK